MTNKNWGFEKRGKTRKINIFTLWKASILFVIFTILLSFFSIVNDVVYADKTSLINKLDHFSKLSFLYKNNIPSQTANIILDYKNGNNILKDKYKPIFLLAENNIGKLVSILGYAGIKEKITNIYNQFKPFRNDIFSLLGKNKEKNYLIILENTGEERPDSGFFGSFIKVSLSGGHLKSFEIIDSYKVIFDQCGLEGKNWYKNCDRKNLHLYHNYKEYKNLFKYTSFLNSNYFGFTELNAENIIQHYKKAYPKQNIDGVIFIKSDILKYLLPEGEKIIRKMETTNYKNLMRKKAGKLDKGIKDEYLNFTKKLILSKKREIFKNFIENYNKIRKEGLIRLYFKGISQNFQRFLKENNFMYYNDNKSAYLFFYNVGNNKSSKFVDHIITINNKVLVNPKKIPLLNGRNIISYKNIFNEKADYYKFLENEKIDKKSFLWWKDTKHYDTLLIIPSNCKKQKIGGNKFIVNCK